MTGLNMLAGWTTVGDTIMIEQMPILGGYPGGIEETAICDVATTLGSFACFSGNFHLDGQTIILEGEKLYNQRDDRIILSNGLRYIERSLDRNNLQQGISRQAAPKEKKKDRNAKIRHTERNRTIEDLLAGKKTCPEETIYQFGTLDEHASVEDLVLVVTEFMASDVI